MKTKSKRTEDKLKEEGKSNSEEFEPAESAQLPWEGPPPVTSKSKSKIILILSAFFFPILWPFIIWKFIKNRILALVAILSIMGAYYYFIFYFLFY